jgi:hypothetical protein
VTFTKNLIKLLQKMGRKEEAAEIAAAASTLG